MKRKYYQEILSDCCKIIPGLDDDAMVRIADQIDDFPTADMLSTRMEVHEKNAWMLRSLLQ